MTIKPFLPFILALTSLIVSCLPKTSCNQLPNAFSAYDEALLQIESADFRISESVNTSKSSWIRNASYYSCDGQTGYFIIETDKKKYVHSGLPYTVWKQFEDAKSFGKFYNEKVKYNYAVQLTK